MKCVVFQFNHAMFCTEMRLLNHRNYIVRLPIIIIRKVSINTFLISLDMLQPISYILDKVELRKCYIYTVESEEL